MDSQRSTPKLMRHTAIFAPEPDFDIMPARSPEKRQALLHKLQ